MRLRKGFFKRFLISSVTILMLSCATKTVYVREAPPSARTEVRAAKPGFNYVWIDGHWKWSGKRYVWVSGHWVKQHKNKVWIAGHWEHTRRGYVWVNGHWK